MESAALVVVLLLVAAAPAAVCQVPTILDSFDVERSKPADYAAFLADLDYHVGTTGERAISGHPVLGRQHLNTPPAHWLKINLTGGSGGGHAALLIRSDNLYISAFANRMGRWFAFRGDEGKVPSSTRLNYGGGYNDLFGRRVGFGGLDSIPISKKEALAHLDALASFRGGADGHLKRPLAFFILAVCEAERFVQIRNAVFQRWGGDEKNKHLTGKPIGDMRVTTLVVNWGKISCALLARDRNGQTQQAWDRNEEARKAKELFGIKDARDALSRVNPILQSTRCSWSLLD